MGTRIELSSRKFNRLTVIERIGTTIHGKVKWKCVCDCGESVIAISSNLLNGNTKSCGCLQKEKVSILNKTHGMSGKNRQRVYRIWANMKTRCTNPNSPSYENYGGKGITFCKKWGSFEGFLEDVGYPPSNKHSLDRFPNKEGNYEPGNWRWATDFEQTRNTRKNVWMEHDGIKMVQKDWANKWGITQSLLKQHLTSGKPFELIFEYFENRKRLKPMKI